MARRLLTKRERFAIDLAVRHAEHSTRFEFSVFVGASDPETRWFAQQLHGSLIHPHLTVLVMVDPDQRSVEVVTGSATARRLTDVAVQAVLGDVRATFERGPLAGGVVHIVRALAEATLPTSDSRRSLS